MGSPLSKTKPEWQLIEPESGEGLTPLEEFYWPEDNVEYDTFQGVDVALDFEDDIILLQRIDTRMINLPFAKETENELYHWFKYRKLIQTKYG